jgi:hypothetical protein
MSGVSVVIPTLPHSFPLAHIFRRLALLTTGPPG